MTSAAAGVAAGHEAMQRRERPIDWAPSIAFLHFAVQFMLGGSLVYLGALFVMAPEQKLRGLWTLLLMAVAVVAQLLLGRGRSRAAVFTLCGGMWVYITLTSIFVGGVNGTTVIAYPLIIILIGWLIGSRAAITFSLLAVLASFAFALSESAGWLPAAPPTPPLLRWVVQTCVFVVAAFLVAHIVRSYRQRLDEVHRLTAELAHAQSVAQVGSWVYNAQDDLIRLSAEACRIAGFVDGAGVNFAGFLARIHPDERAAVESAWRATVPGNKCIDREHRMLIAGEYRWLRLRADFEFDDTGRIGSVVGTVQDVTERRRAEVALQMSHSGVEAISDALFWIAPDTRIVEVNPAACSSLGYTRDELLKMRIPDFAANFAEDVWRRQFEDLRQGGTFRFESWHRRKDGSTFPVDVVCNFVRVEGRELACAFARNRSERRRREAELQALNARLAATLEAIPDLLFELSGDGRYIDCFTRRPELLAAPIDALRVRMVSEILPSGPTAVCLGALAEAAATGHSHGRQYELPLPQGSRWFELSIARKAPVAGEATSFIVLSRDITVRKRAEEALRVSEMQLESILSATADGILAVDNDGRVLRTNRRFAELWRIPPEVLEGGDDARLVEFVANQLADPQGFRDKVALLYHSNAEARDVVYFKDGRSFARYTAPLFAGGVRTGRIWSFADITEQKRATDALRLQEERLRLAMQATRQGWFDFNVQTGEINVSPEYAVILGYEPAQFASSVQTWFDNIHPDDRQRVKDLFTECIATGERREGEYRRRAHTGEWKWIHSVGKIVEHDSAGRALRMIGTHADITERVRAESKLAMAIDVTGVVLWEFDFANGVLNYDHSLLPVLGFDADETPPRGMRDWIERLHPADRAAFQAHVDAAQSAGDGAFDMTYRVIARSGRVSWLHTRGRIVQRDAAGAPVAGLGTTINVTAARTAEEALRESEGRFRELLQNAPSIAVQGYAPDGTVRYWNRACEHFYGYTEQEALGRNILELIIPPEVREAVREAIAGMARSGEPVAASELMLMHKDGSRVPVYSSHAVVKRPGAEPELFCIDVDLSERKAAEAALERLNAELESRVERRTAELEAANRELSEFSYSIAHDMRAPVRAMNGFSSMVLRTNEGRLDATSVSHLRRVVAGSERMGLLIDELLSLARLSRQDLHLQDFDLSALADSVTVALRETEPERRVECTVQPGMRARGDTGLIRVVLENLLGNAWKFTAKTANPRITVDCVADPSGIVYRVGDNGAGFDMRYAGKLFAPFQRLHHADEFEGTGIGLATVRKIIQRHGGRIWVESAVNAGTTVYFTLGEQAPAAGG